METKKYLNANLDYVYKYLLI